MCPNPKLGVDASRPNLGSGVDAPILLMIIKIKIIKTQIILFVILILLIIIKIKMIIFLIFIQLIIIKIIILITYIIILKISRMITTQIINT